MSNFRNLAGKPDKWDQSFQDLSTDNYEFLYGRSKGKRDCISSRKFLQCSFFGELLFCSSQRRRGKSKLMCITVVQWSRSCLNVQINRVRLPSTLFSVSLYRFWSLFLTLFFFWPFFLYSYCWPCWSWTWINIYFKLKSGVLFWKRDFKSSWSAYWPSLRPDKNHKQSRHVPPLKQPNFSTVCGVLCVCFSWCQRTLIWEINFVTSKQFFSAIDAVWSWWSCIYHEFKNIFEEN